MIVRRLAWGGGLRPSGRASARTRWAPIRPTNSFAPPIFYARFAPDGQITKTCPAPLRKIFRLTCRANQFYQFAPSFPDKRGVSRSSRTREGMRWTLKRRRETVSQGESLVSDQPARRRTAPKRTAKPCGPGIRCWCQAAGGEIDPTGSHSHQAGSDGGKTNSSPGRSRHKP
jgi:hypothetical protein